jgi:hypothetical protein
MRDIKTYSTVNNDLNCYDIDGFFDYQRRAFRDAGTDRYYCFSGAFNPKGTGQRFERYKASSAATRTEHSHMAFDSRIYPYDYCESNRNNFLIIFPFQYD